VRAQEVGRLPKKAGIPHRAQEGPSCVSVTAQISGFSLHQYVDIVLYQTVPACPTLPRREVGPVPNRRRAQVPERERVTEYKYVIRLPGDLGEALQQRASVEDRPIARIIRAALRLYLESPAPRPA
jgi:hypothetical protein